MLVNPGALLLTASKLLQWNATALSWTSYTETISPICPVGWGFRIHRLHICKGVRLPQRVSWIWHKAIWWWCSSNAGALGNAEYSSLLSLPDRLCPGLVAPDRVLSMGQIELNRGFKSLLFLHLNCVLMLNWIAWNRFVLTSKLRTYTKVNYLKKNCFYI